MARGVTVCVTIRRSTHVTSPWDPSTNIITIPSSLDAERETRAVRAVLSALSAPQPDSGALCWCGALVDIGAPLILPSGTR